MSNFECMIDIETMGNTSAAVVLSIGAVMFDPATGEIGKQFYAAIDVEDSMRHGTVDGSTLKWWMQQSDEARQKAVGGTSPLEYALRELAAFYTRGTPVWGNGPAFDMVILENAYLSVFGKKAPWDFWDHRDCRTMKSIGSTFGYSIPVIKGVAHNALDDAIHQAKWVSDIWRMVIGKASNGSREAVDDLLG